MQRQSNEQAVIEDSCDVTVASQMTLDRKGPFEAMASKWLGPIVLAFYGTSEMGLSLAKFVSDSPVLSKRRNIVYRHVQPADNKNEIYTVTNNLYPINYMRNVATKSVKTPFVFLLDVDFVPSDGMYNRLKATLAKLGACENTTANDRVAYVIPAFESKYQTTQLAYKNLPADKKQLIRAWSRKNPTITSFHVDHVIEQISTLYNHWRFASEPYKVKYQYHYEPYFVGRTQALPPYDIRIYW